MPDKKDTIVARLVVERGYLTEAQIDEALETQRKASDEMGLDMPLLQLLENKHLLTPDQTQEIRNATAVESGEARLVAGYEVISKIGAGGMGAVYKAKSQTTGQLVALKILPPSLATPDLVKRFKREAKIVSSLDHKHIVGCVEFGYDKRRKLHFCALELIEGEDLDRRISALTVIPEAEATRTTLQVTEALQHAHLNGLVHRDIKPANIMVTADGTAKLLDLGLARPANSEVTRLTQTGAFVGSPYYASPEQASGGRDLDIRSDIYSLGCTLYHMVTGKPPFSGTTVMQVLQKHLKEQMPWPQESNPKLSDGICQIIAKMMAKSPDDRYQDPKELLVDLHTHLEGGEPEITEEALKGSSVNVPVTVRQRVRERRRGARPSREPGRARPEPRGKRHASAETTPDGKKSLNRKKPPSVGIMVGIAVVVVIVLGMGVAMLGGKRRPRARPPANAAGVAGKNIRPERVPGLQLWLDCQDINGDGAAESIPDGTAVALWVDKSGTGRHARQPKTDQQAVYKKGVLNSKPVLRFDGTNDWYSFARISDIRTVFWVIKEDADASAGCRHLLGDSKALAFHRGNGKSIWSSKYAHSNISSSGTTRIDGKVVDALKTAVPTTFSIIDLVTRGNVQAGQLHKDRTYGDRVWDGDVAEIIIYNRALTAAQRDGVYNYLRAKWFGESPMAVASGARPPKVPADAEKFGGHFYKPFTRKMSWHDAKRFCEKQGGHLITITSREEQRFVAEMARRSKKKALWIGLTDEGHPGDWRWVTGEPLKYKCWAPNEPNNYGGKDEHWGSIKEYKKDQYAWNDDLAGKTLVDGFICEW